MSKFSRWMGIEEFRPLLINVTLLGLLSCSSTKTQLVSHQDPLCWAGEGKGRLRFGSEKTVFSFVSQTSDSDKTWDLSFQIPFREEETVRFHSQGESFRFDKVPQGHGKAFQRLLQPLRPWLWALYRKPGTCPQGMTCLDPVSGETPGELVREYRDSQGEVFLLKTFEQRSQGKVSYYQLLRTSPQGEETQLWLWFNECQGP